MIWQSRPICPEYPDMAVSSGHLASLSTKIVKRAEKELQQSKIILRHLPPDFTLENLTETISPLPDHTFFYFFPGDESLGRYGCARAYINFSNTSDILPFRDQFDGRILESAKGMKYRLVVEYAPYQAVPKRKKPDQRSGTIEQDSDYQAFLEAYQTEVNPLPSVDVTELVSSAKPLPVKLTPLVEYLKDRKTSSKYRGSRNKVVLIAPDSKRKKGKGEGHKLKKGTSKEGGRLDKTSMEEKKDEGKKKQPREKTEGKPVVILGRDKTKKSSSYNDDSSLTGRGGSKGSIVVKSQSVTASEGATTNARVTSKSSTDGHSAGNDTSSSSPKGRQVRNKDRPDQKFYVPRGGGASRRGGEGEVKDKRSDNDASAKTSSNPSSSDKKRRSAKAEDGRRGGSREWRGGEGGGRGYYSKPSRYADYDRGWEKDRRYPHDGDYRSSGRHVDHEYHFQEDEDDGTGSRKGGGGGGGARHSSKGRGGYHSRQYSGQGGRDFHSYRK